MSKQAALKTIIQAIHATNIKIVLVSSGGGTNAIASFLRQPGASNTILESYINYSRESLEHYLLRRHPSQIQLIIFHCNLLDSLKGYLSNLF